MNELCLTFIASKSEKNYAEYKKIRRTHLS